MPTGASTENVTPEESGWRKSSFCYNSNCFEVNRIQGKVALRVNEDGPVILGTPSEWSDFISGIKAGEFDWLASSSD